MTKLESTICMHVLTLKAMVGSYKGKTITLDYLVSIRYKEKSNFSCVQIKLRASIKVTVTLHNSAGEIVSCV